MTVINSVNVKDVLAEARELLAQPGKWTKGEFARDAFGNRCMVYAPEACSFCAAGALRVAAKSLDCGPGAYLTALAYLQWAIRRVTGNEESFVATTNDGAESVEEILVYFDDAIAHCPGE